MFHSVSHLDLCLSSWFPRRLWRWPLCEITDVLNSKISCLQCPVDSLAKSSWSNFSSTVSRHFKTCRSAVEFNKVLAEYEEREFISNCAESIWKHVQRSQKTPEFALWWRCGEDRDFNLHNSQIHHNSTFFLTGYCRILQLCQNLWSCDILCSTPHCVACTRTTLLCTRLSKPSWALRPLVQRQSPRPGSWENGRDVNKWNDVKWTIKWTYCVHKWT